MPDSQISPEKIRPLPRVFYSRDPRRVARELLGKILVREDTRRRTARIVEVEAYLGEKDPASHSAAGNTARTSVLFGPPGHAYIYFIYGNHYCLNVSCEPAGQAGGVLFRALEPLSGVEEMAEARGLEIHRPRNRGVKHLGLDGSGLDNSGLDDSGLSNSGLTNKTLINLTSGPGRLSEAFSITRTSDNGCDLTSASSSLWIGDDGTRPRGIRTSPRIGITKAIDKPWRYFLHGNPFVSRVHPKQK